MSGNVPDWRLCNVYSVGSISSSDPALASALSGSTSFAPLNHASSAYATIKGFEVIGVIGRFAVKMTKDWDEQLPATRGCVFTAWGRANTRVTSRQIRQVTAKSYTVFRPCSLSHSLNRWTSSGS